MIATKENTYIKITCALLLIIITIVCFINAIYYFNIENGNCAAINRDTALTLTWINAIVTVLSFLLFLWIMWLLVRENNI